MKQNATKTWYKPSLDEYFVKFRNLVDLLREYKTAYDCVYGSCRAADATPL